MSESKARTQEQWIVLYFSNTRSDWLIDDVLCTLQEAQRYIQNQPPRRPPVDAWRIVHRVTKTTVTETVIE
jgi:hypothetical protein